MGVLGCPVSTKMKTELTWDCINNETDTLKLYILKAHGGKLVRVTNSNIVINESSRKYENQANTVIMGIKLSNSVRA